MTKRALKILGYAAGGGWALERRRVDPVQRSLDRAPIDDEPLSEEDIRAIEEAEAETGPFLSLDEVKKALGID